MWTHRPCRLRPLTTLRPPRRPRSNSRRDGRSARTAASGANPPGAKRSSSGERPITRARVTSGSPGDHRDCEELPVAVDVSQVANVETEPGELPATMAAWVIREERQGEPVDAFQVEEIEVPEPGAFEVIVRVMAAGVNFNNVWAALGEPVGVWRYGDHPRYGHHIGGSDASGIVWKVGEGVTRW